MGLSDSTDPSTMPGGPDTAPVEEINPFSPDNAVLMNFIVQARIYDVLMALLAESNKTLHMELLKLHAAGAFMGPSPAYNGNFVTDELNAQFGNEIDNADSE